MNPGPTPPPSPYARWAVALAVVAAVCLGAFLRLHGAGDRCLVDDEYATYMFAKEPLARLWGPDAAVETNPPLYYSLQHLWLAFGDDPGTMRGLPALFGIASVPLAFLLGRRVLGPWAGVLAAFLLATMPIHLYHSTEIRCYSMLIFATLWGMVCLAGLLPGVGRADAPDAAANAAPGLAAGPRHGRPLHWAGYFLAATLCIWSHNTGVFFPFLATLLVGWFWLVRRAVGWGFVLRWVVVNCLVLAATSWWLWMMLEQSRTLMQSFWIPPLTLRGARGQLMSVYTYAWWAKPILYLAAVAGLWVLRRRPLLLAFLLIFLLGHPLLVALVSLKMPMFIYRIISWSSVLFCILLAAGPASFRWRQVGVALGVVLVGLQIVGHGKPLRPAGPESDLAPIARQLHAEFDPTQDYIVLVPMGVAEWEFTYEARGLAVADRLVGMTPDDRPLQIEIWQQARRVPRAEAAALVGGSRKVWVIVDRDAAPAAAMFSELDATLRAMDPEAATAKSGRFELTVYRASEAAR